MRYQDKALQLPNGIFYAHMKLEGGEHFLKQLRAKSPVVPNYASSILKTALGIEELLDKSSNDTLIQLDKSVPYIRKSTKSRALIDGVYITKSSYIMLTCTSCDTEEVFSELLENVSKHALVRLVHELVRMAENELNKYLK